MVLATAKIGDFDRFWNTFSTKGAEKRKQHGCKGATSFGLQMTATGFGRSSTGTRRAGKASPRTPRSRRSFRKPGLRKVRPSRRSSSASTTPRQARDSNQSFDLPLAGIGPISGVNRG